MAAHSGAEARQPTAGRPDGQYAFVAGLYVASFLAPALVLGLSRVVADAGALYVGFLVAVTGVTAVAGWAASRTRGLAVGLGRRDAVWLLVAAPFGWFVGVFGAAAGGIDVPDLAAPLAVIGTAGGMLLGIALVAMSRTRHANAALDGALELAAWEARWPREWRRVAAGVSIAAFAVSAVGIVAAFAFGSEWGWRLYYLVFVGVVLMNALNPRTFRATDAGLAIEHPLQRQFRPWSAYASYDVTDTALVLRPAAWWRPAHRCDLADVEDVDVAREALEECLPR
jgi:MFS family permease